MKTAVITSIDDRAAENLEKDFLPTLRDSAKYTGPVFVMYYGKDNNFVRRISEKFNVKFIKLERSRKTTVYNQRYIDLPKLFNILPKEISQVMIADGGDIWFQKPIFELFELVGDNLGLVEEDFDADGEFNKGVISQITNEKIKKIFTEKSKNTKLINGGMIVGDREKIETIVREVNIFLKKIRQDFFGLDQTILNYIIRESGRGIFLDQEYNYTLYSNQNKFFVRDGLIYNDNKKLVSVVHNCGGLVRLFEHGRKDISSITVMPKECPGTFWGITTFFNPAHYKNKVVNYRHFRESSKRQGLKLLTVECAFGKDPFELKDGDADMLLQIRTDSPLWQKERLLNIGLEKLPEDCDKFAWLDADVIFLNDNWVKETADLLNSYAVVQPFSTYIRLEKGVSHMSLEEFEKTPFSEAVDIDGKRFFGVGYRVSKLGRIALSKNMLRYGHVGLAWSARRDVFREDGLFDKSLLSAVDMIMAHSFYNNKLNKECDYYVAEPVKKHIYEWSNRIYPKVNGSVYYTDGALLHLWHGAMKTRNHEECKRILEKFDFSPDDDIKKDASGCWTWSSQKPGLHKAFRRFFYIRNESDSLRIKIMIFLETLFERPKSIGVKIYLKFDWLLGQIGIIIRKISPVAYRKLKNIETAIKGFKRPLL